MLGVDMNESEATTKIIEVNGIKMEVDLREAKVINKFKVGDPVKLIKNDSGNVKIMAAAISGFVMTDKLSAIEVVWLEEDYWSGIKFMTAVITSKTTEYELVAYSEHDRILNKQSVLNCFNKKQDELEAKLDELRAKRQYFEDNFGKLFEGSPVVKE